MDSDSEESQIQQHHDDDSDEDPTFDISMDETRIGFSKLSLRKSKSKNSKKMESDSEEEVEEGEIVIPKLNEMDQKCFEKIEMMIKGGQLEKLKVDQCKVYLRKYGLRLTGKKEVLVARIREHIEIIDGGGENKYPPSIFVLNCKGDACTGDVVMFEQNVYEMYNKASRSATGPPCGTRVVVGRIVKESYGAAKQQHTFTIEVLWSKGEKPLPPLHPLLIKGRNLYKLKTMRQRWDDEEERKKVMQEKHQRGHAARFSREIRIQERESRKIRKANRMENREGNTQPDLKIPQHHVQGNNYVCAEPAVDRKQAGSSYSFFREGLNIQGPHTGRNQSHIAPGPVLGRDGKQHLEKSILGSHPQEHVNSFELPRPECHVNSFDLHKYHNEIVKPLNENYERKDNVYMWPSMQRKECKSNYDQPLKAYNMNFAGANEPLNFERLQLSPQYHQPRSRDYHKNDNHRPYETYDKNLNRVCGFSQVSSSRLLESNDFERSQLSPRHYRRLHKTSDENFQDTRPQHFEVPKRHENQDFDIQRPLCRFYRYGNCWYGDKCKYLHN